MLNIGAKRASCTRDGTVNCCVFVGRDDREWSKKTESVPAQPQFSQQPQNLIWIALLFLSSFLQCAPQTRWTSIEREFVASTEAINQKRTHRSNNFDAQVPPSQFLGISSTQWEKMFCEKEQPWVTLESNDSYQSSHTNTTTVPMSLYHVKQTRQRGTSELWPHLVSMWFKIQTVQNTGKVRAMWTRKLELTQVFGPSVTLQVWFWLGELLHVDGRGGGNRFEKSNWNSMNLCQWKKKKRRRRK